MLKLAAERDLGKITEFCGCNVFGTYILCRANAYGFEREFSKTWFSENHEKVDTVISSFDNNAVILTSDKTDFEELSYFVSAMGFLSVLTDCETARKCDILDFSQKSVFVLKQKSSEFSDECISDPDLKEVYGLLCECFSRIYSDEKNAYLFWLSDYMFRSKRGYAHIKAAVKDGEICSAAITSAESENAVVVGSVACKKEKRRNGFGKSAVLSLSSEALNDGKTVFAISEDEESSRFYKKIGFTEIGKAAYIERF